MINFPNEAKCIADFLESEGFPEYQNKLQELSDLYDNGIYEGNWDVSTNFDDGTRDIRIIQEDEYEQHMDDSDEKPDDKDLIGYTGDYLFWA